MQGYGEKQMKTIKSLMIALGLLAISSTGFASSVSPSSFVDGNGQSAIEDIFLTNDGDIVDLSDDFPVNALGPYSYVFYGLTLDGLGSTTAGARSVIFEPLGFGDITVSIFSDISFSLASLVASDTNTITTVLDGGTQYFLHLVGEQNTGFTGNISAVPVPAAGILFASALFGAGFIGRRKTKAAKSNMIGAFARAA